MKIKKRFGYYEAEDKSGVYVSRGGEYWVDKYTGKPNDSDELANYFYLWSIKHGSFLQRVKDFLDAVFNQDA